jgi:phosphoribosylanthranilate isomerase
LTKIKICGIRRPEDIAMVNKYKPDYVGFVFFEKSHRNLSVDEAMYLSSILDEDITPVGVFVNENPKKIIELFKSNTIKVAQLHGDEDEKYIKSLKENSFIEVDKELKVIKALEIRDNEDIVKWESSDADYLLLDSGKGSGRTFKWSLIQNVNKPFFLAGGLDSANVADAINIINPFAVDVSSGTETDKVKDEEKIKNFIDNVRSLS